MTMSRGCWTVLGFAGFEAAAWLALVPATVTPVTFLVVNGIAAGLFCVGFASAANGLPTRSISQLLYELENDPRAP
jgi:hypothetical protein